VNLGDLLLQGRLEAQEWAFGGWLPEWWPVIAFPWWVFVGSIACFAISFLFPTPLPRVKEAEQRAAWEDAEK